MTSKTKDEFDARSARTRQPIPLWSGAFDRATKEHTAEVIGAYMLILMAMWESKTCDLPNDDRFLAWIAKVSPTIWRRKLAPTIMPMLSQENSRIFSEKLQENARKTEEYCRKQHERKFGKISPKPLKDNDVGETVDLSVERATDRTAENPKQLTINISKEEEGAHQREAFAEWTPDRLHGEVMAAVGLNAGRIPRYWMPPHAPIHVWRWHTQLGLTPDQIIEAARLSRTNHQDPPDGPKALDRDMQNFAAVLSTPPMQPRTTGTKIKHQAGAANARSAFDSALNAALDAAPVGTPLVDRSRSDPFAKQRL